MVTSDNIFNIYYDIGRALPFEVQRFPKDATDWYKNQSVLVTEIHTRGKYKGRKLIDVYLENHQYLQ